MISGSKQPGNDIDVYLSPLIEDLKLMWDQGVEVLTDLLMKRSGFMPCYFAQSMTFRHIVTYQVIVLRVIKHVQYAKKTLLLKNLNMEGRQYVFDIDGFLDVIILTRG